MSDAQNRIQHGQFVIQDATKALQEILAAAAAFNQQHSALTDDPS